MFRKCGWGPLSVFICYAGSIQQSLASDIRLPFDLEAQPLSSALIRICNQANLDLLFDPNQLARFQAPPLKADIDVEEALERVLAGTGLRVAHVNQHTVSIESNTQSGDAARSSHAAMLQPLTDATFRQTRDIAIGRNDAIVNDSGEGGSNPSDAQDSSRRGGLEEVLVSAQKRTERLQDVPVPVTVLDAQTLAETEKTRLQDFFATVPGLNLITNGANQADINIRGVTTGGLTNSTVGITIDDIPYGSSNLLGFSSVLVPDFDPADLKSIEVLKGPQGTLYGASSIGGLIKFNTLDPSTSKAGGYVQVGSSSVYHSEGQLGYNVRGSLNIPLSDTAAIRISGFTRRDPGFVENLATDTDHANSVKVSGGRVSALWTPISDITLKFGILLQETVGDGSPAVNTNYLLQPTLGDLNQNRTRGTEATDSQYRLYTANLNWNLGAMDFQSISGYGVNSFEQIVDSTPSLGGFSTTGASGNGNYFRTEKFTQEFRLSSLAGHMIDWLGGLFYTHEDTSAVQPVDEIDPASGSIVGNLLTSSFPTTYTEYAAFGDVTVHFTDQFNVQLGARESQNRQVYNETDTGPLVLAFFGFSPPLLVPTVHTKDNSFTYLVTPQFKISPDLMVYARVASGYRSGGPNSDATLFKYSTEYGPDKTVNYEIGSKGELIDHKLSFDVSLYHIDWKHIQIALTDPLSQFSYFTNGGDARIQGAELSLHARPINGMTLALAGSFIDAKLTSSFPVGSSSVGNSGDRLPFSSRLNGSFSADQEFALSASVAGFGGASFSYVGDREASFPISATYVRLRMPGYAEIGVHGGIRYDNWTFTIYGNNLADRRGAINAGALSGGTTTDPFEAVYIRPRTIGITVAKEF